MTLEHVRLPSAELRDRLNRFPRVDYGPLPTPLEPMPRLSRRFGGPELWVKRDDNLGPAMGGNKGRKLAFLMAEILAQGKRKVVTFGDAQSNHARMTAAACAAHGLEAHLFFFERRPAETIGNLLLNTLCGARLHFIPYGRSESAGMTLETTNRLVRVLAFLLTGPGTYFMPVGGHSRTGCLGYVEAALEIDAQLRAAALPLQKTTVVTAVGTGGTLAGLLAGQKLLQAEWRLLGLDVEKLWKALPASLARLTAELCQALGLKLSFHANEVPVIEHIERNAGYGQLTPAIAAAIKMAAHEEGLLLDPVFTGRALAALQQLVQQDYFAADEHIVFIHTGGVPGLWPYAAALTPEPVT